MSAEPLRRQPDSASSRNAYEMEEGAVVLTDGSVSVVRTDAGDVRAQRAASCLLEPAPCDRVLLARGNDETFVVAIIARAKPGRVSIASDEPIEIVSRKGSVTVLGGQDVALIAGKIASLTAPELAVQATRATACVEELGLVGRIATVGVGVLKTAAETVERTAGRLVERLGRSYRFIEEGEQVRARDLDFRTEENLSMRAEHAIVLARKIVKVDGTQIHMG